LNGVYKLVATKENGAWTPCIKISSNPAKATDPGHKRLVRYFDASGHPVGGVAYADGETVIEQGAEADRDRLQPHRSVHLADAARSEDLLQTVFEHGQRTQPSLPIADIRAHALAGMAALPEEFKRLRNPEIYRVLLSPQLGSLKDSLMADSN